jgi:homopolymeric O-antigen transport system ATP-binding protein
VSHIAIRAENLSKQFRIAASQTRYRTFRQYRTLRDHISNVVRLRGRRERAATDTIWGLRDVSFEVASGEAVGIIGPNGAGKSTLLKILSRITEPTTGRAELYGRVGSLLEVGTGFHSELTGRENLYLNGAILGMRKADIDRKADEIVAFAETGKFIDTPVKHYSSGMYMRLAFAVAAHLEPEILIVDEVLAVGDLNFQNKCLGKMQDVASQGRTVLFVSHNMGAITNLCTSALWLDAGRIVAQGAVNDTVAAYIQSVGTASQNDSSSWKHKGSGEARFMDARMLDASGAPRETFGMGESVVVEFDLEFSRSFSFLYMAVVIKRAETGLAVLELLNHDSGSAFADLSVGKHRLSVEIPNCLLYPGRYRVSLRVAIPRAVVDHVDDVLSFSMVHSGVSKRTTPFAPSWGVFHSPSVWRET